MRSFGAGGVWWASMLLVGCLVGCYQQPVIPADKPLRCTSSSASGQCPAGYACIADRVCASESCTSDQDCPQGLTCSPKSGCGLPGVSAGDGGAVADAVGLTLDGATDRFGSASNDDGAPPNVGVTVDASSSGGRD